MMSLICRYFSFAEALQFLQKGDHYAKALQFMQLEMDALRGDVENGEIVTGTGVKQRLDSMHENIHGKKCSCAMKGEQIFRVRKSKLSKVIV